MAECIRVTALTSFYTCAFKYKNEPYEPNPKQTYHGDIINIAVNSKGPVDRFIDYRSANIESSISLKYNLEITTKKATKIIADIYEKYDNVFQESKMYLKYDDDHRIEGTPDVMFFNNEGGEFYVADFKCSTHSRYSGNEMRDLNMQTYIYPLFAMNYFGVEEVVFNYIIFDKNTSKVKKEFRKRTRAECEAKVKEVMDLYIDAGLREEYTAKENKLCSFCSLKKQGNCPLFGGRKIEEVEEELF